MATKAIPADAILVDDRRREGFSTAQIEQLLRPINGARVLADGKGFSHVSQQDILAHLTRIFGFGNFDIDIKNVELVFEAPTEKVGRFDVCYKALVRLTIRNEYGAEICHYENGSMETSRNQTRGDGHDLAYKSAISLSIKRSAIALGDQFGLSLYNKGQTSALVRSTLVGLPIKPESDVQEGVPQQVSLGNDETEAAVAPTVAQIAPVVAIEPLKPVGAPITPVEVKKAPAGLLLATYNAVVEAIGLDPLREIWVRNANYLDESFVKDGKSWTLRYIIEARKAEIEATK